MNLLVYRAEEGIVQDVLIVTDVADDFLENPDAKMKMRLVLYCSGLLKKSTDFQFRKYDPASLEPALVGYSRDQNNVVYRITWQLLKQKAEAPVSPNIQDITS